MYRRNLLHMNPAMRRNVSDQRKALRTEYRNKYGNEWYKDKKIKDKFDAEMKGMRSSKKGSFTRGGETISRLADQTDSELIKELASQSKGKKSRGRGKKPFASKEIVDEFIDYAYGFYGRGGVFGMNTTKTQLRAATKEYIKAFQDKNADYRYVVENAFSKIPKSFDGDTIDRENVAVIVEDMYGKKKPSERFSGKKPSSRGRGKKKSKVKPLKGKALERAMKATSDRAKYLDFTEELEIKIKKKLGPLIKGRQGISDMDIGSTDAGDYMIMMLGKRDLQLVISKPRSWLVMVENTATGNTLANSVPAKQGTTTRLANEAVKVYKSYMKSDAGKKSSSRKSSTKSRAKGSKKMKPEFKIGKSGKTYKWQLIVEGKDASRAGYKSRATAKKGLMQAIASHEKLLEKYGIDAFKLFCEVRDSK